MEKLSLLSICLQFCDINCPVLILNGIPVIVIVHFEVELSTKYTLCCNFPDRYG
jgi:hypothetical protein